MTDVTLPSFFTDFLDQSLAWIYAWEPYVQRTVILVPPFVGKQVELLAQQVGFDVATVNYVLGLFLCYPLGLIMNALPYGPIRHVFSFLLGAFLLQFTLGVQWIHQLITSLVVYVLLMILPRKTATWVVPTLVMTYCVLGHLHRQYINYLGWDLDFTGAQMVLTQKLYMMAYNLYDGEQLARGKNDRAAQKLAEFSIPRLPNLMEYLGYTFCFASVLSGPAYEYTIYRNACDGSLLYDAEGKPRGKIPSNVWPTLVPLLTSLGNMATYVVLGTYFPLHDPVNPQKNLPVILRPDFLQKPWLYRYAYMWISISGVRQKYYFAWKNAEGANNLWYAGFEGFDDESGRVKGWDNSCNSEIWKFETAPSVQVLSKEWNKKTSSWLARYVYIRTNGNLFMVYSLSAFWHGFYPGYYLYFLSGPLMMFCDRVGRRKISPYFSEAKWSPYGIVCILASQIMIIYMVSAFILLSFDWSWQNWKSHYFFGHIGCILFFLIVSRFPTPKPPAASSKDKQS